MHLITTACRIAVFFALASLPLRAQHAGGTATVTGHVSAVATVSAGSAARVVKGEAQVSSEAVGTRELVFSLSGRRDLTFHDLRHTWSTRAAECGVPESVRRDILGHSSPTMTGDYTHTSPEAMEKAMELVADYSRERIFSLTAKSRQAS